MAPVVADLLLQEGQQCPQYVVAQIGAGVGRVAEDGGTRCRRVVDAEVGQQHDDLHESGTHLVAGTGQKVLAEAARVIEESVMGEPGADRRRRAQVNAQDVTPKIFQFIINLHVQVNILPVYISKMS